MLGRGENVPVTTFNMYGVIHTRDDNEDKASGIFSGNLSRQHHTFNHTPISMYGSIEFNIDLPPVLINDVPDRGAEISGLIVKARLRIDLSRMVYAYFTKPA
ncbi:hypothetical protein ACR75N_04850 [Parabacteroides merdae]|uniref:hypothetical protein n=1 Tax=Parabacteroides merdae TaxID=46503 RepID=UPI003DA2185F